MAAAAPGHARLPPAFCQAAWTRCRNSSAPIVHALADHGSKVKPSALGRAFHQYIPALPITSQPVDLSAYHQQSLLFLPPSHHLAMSSLSLFVCGLLALLCVVSSVSAQLQEPGQLQPAVFACGGAGYDLSTIGDLSLTSGGVDYVRRRSTQTSPGVACGAQWSAEPWPRRASCDRQAHCFHFCLPVWRLCCVAAVRR